MCEFIEELFNDWHWIFSLDCDGIELPEVHAKMIRAVFLLD